MELIQCIAALPSGKGQWNSRGTRPQCCVALGNGTPVVTPPRGCRKWNAVGTLPHTTPGQYGGVLQEFHDPLPQGGCRCSTARYPKVVRRCAAVVPLSTAPRQYGTAQQKVHCPLPQCCHCTKGSPLPTAPT